MDGTCTLGTANTWKSTRHSRTLDPLSIRFAFQMVRKSLQQGTRRHKHRSLPLKKRSPMQAEVTVHSEGFFAEVRSGNVMVGSLSWPPWVLLRLTTEIACSILHRILLETVKQQGSRTEHNLPTQSLMPSNQSISIRQCGRRQTWKV